MAVTGTSEPSAPRRIRHQARDSLAVAAFSLASSAAALGVVWVVLLVLT